MQFGYVPLENGAENPPIGNIPAVSSIIIRCIIHSCLFWAACNGKVCVNLHTNTQLSNSRISTPYFMKELAKTIAQFKVTFGSKFKMMLG